MEINMYRIAILGCENSHADIFLNYVIKDKVIKEEVKDAYGDLIKEDLYSDVEVVGVYSDDTEAAMKLNEQYGVYVAKRYDEFVGRIDGLIITARHGDNHLKYALPYLKSGIPMFIDKPITVKEEDARELYRGLKENGIRVCGGSVCKYPELIKRLGRDVREERYGKVFGGMMRAPVSMQNEYGGFFFYSQHLVQALCSVFGFYPSSVKAYVNGNIITCIVRYENYDVTIQFTDGCFEYCAGINCERYVSYESYTLDGCFEAEFDAFYQLLRGSDQPESYEEFVAPVFILNAIDRSIRSGNEEKVNCIN